MTVRPLTPADAGAVARLHVAALPGMLSRLGEPAARTLHAAALSLPETVALGAFHAHVRHNDHLAGFAVGTVDADGYWRRLALARPLALGWVLTGAVLRRPSLLPYLLFGGGIAASGAELTFLAVDESMRGQGVGTRLLAEFEAALRARGASAYELSADADDPVATGFYDARGLVVVREFSEFGMRRRRYRREDLSA